MKKWMSVMLVLLLAITLLAGCSGMSTDELGGGENAPGKNEYVSDSEGGSLTDTSGNTTPENQKMVHKVWLETETEDMSTLLSNIEAQIASLSGYIESQNQQNGSQYSGSRRYRYADLTIRIPAEKLDGFVGTVAKNSNIVSKRQTAENITLSYVAIESHITALETEQTRLLELLAQAKSMADILSIEKRLTEVRSELEKYTSQLRVYDNLVDYATVYLTISEVKEYTQVDEPETVWERIGNGFMESLENLGNFFVELFILIVVTLPYMIPLALPAILILWLIRRKKKKAKSENK